MDEKNLNPLEILKEIRTKVGEWGFETKEQTELLKAEIKNLKEENFRTLEAVEVVNKQLLEVKNQTLQINPQQIKELTAVEAVFKRYEGFYKKFLYISLSSAFVALVTIFSTGYYYSKSIKSKSETRQEIINEIKERGNVMIDNNEFQYLTRQKKALELWKQKNPRDSKSWLKYEKDI